MKSSSSLNVWLADDDEDDRLLFQDALQEVSENFQLSTSTDCIDLIEILHQKKLPDVLFLDLNMPQRNGFECLEELKKDPKLKQIPVIIYSTSSQKEDIRRAYSLGAQFYVKKPSSFYQLKGILNRLLTIDWQHTERNLNTFTFE
ncbi:response regulator [Runella sp.]|uniref:response regulator n=1 Tax=Runella sp. TaxID=1960881 RepID=UPI003D0C4ABF